MGCGGVRPEDPMTREARTMAGIIPLTVPTIQYGGYFLLTSLVNRSSHYMDNPLRQNFFSCRSRPRRCLRDSFPDLPNSGRLCHTADAVALARKDRGARRSNSDSGWLLLFDGLSNSEPAQRVYLADLRWYPVPRCGCSDAGDWSPSQPRHVREESGKISCLPDPSLDC